MKIIRIIALASVLAGLYYTAMPKHKTIVLDRAKTMFFSYKVNGDSSLKLYKFLHNHRGDKRVYIIWNSPGGIVEDMKDMITYIENTPTETVCIANWAASSAFILFEHCDKRFITPKGKLLWHQYKVGFSWVPILPALYSIVKYAELFHHDMLFLSHRMNMDIDHLYAKIWHGDWIMYAGDAVRYRAVDDIVNYKFKEEK